MLHIHKHLRTWNEGGYSLMCNVQPADNAAREAGAARQGRCIAQPAQDDVDVGRGAARVHGREDGHRAEGTPPHQATTTWEPFLTRRPLFY